MSARWLIGRSEVQDLAVMRSQDIGLSFGTCFRKERTSIRWFVPLGYLNDDVCCLPKIFRHKICTFLH